MTQDTYTGYMTEDKNPGVKDMGMALSRTPAALADVCAGLTRADMATDPAAAEQHLAFAAESLARADAEMARFRKAMRKLTKGIRAKHTQVTA